MASPWILYSIVTLTAWGLWGVVLRYASTGLGWKQVYVFSGLATIAVVLVVLANEKSSLMSGVDPRNILTAFIAGLLGAVGYIALVRAFDAGGEASRVVAITSLYPAVTTIISYLVLREPISWSKSLGVVLAVVAVFLLSRS